MSSAIKITGGLFFIVVLAFTAAAQLDGSEIPATNTPAFFAPAGGPGKPTPFSAEISADFIKKVMETSARVEETKKQIADRQAQLYATHPQIKAAREELVRLQKQINAELEKDEQLQELKISRDIIWTTMPSLPKPGHAPGMMPMMRPPADR